MSGYNLKKQTGDVAPEAPIKKQRPPKNMIKRVSAFSAKSEWLTVYAYEIT
jgi:hypothetical protein